MRLLATSNPEGGAALARSVRNLASDAKRIISGPADRRDAEEILRRIDRLQDEWSEAPTAPIHNWLESLRRRVENV